MTEASKPWDEIAELGRQISAELGEFRRDDLLSRWMAHRIAELLDRSENAHRKAEREIAKEEAADLIVRVWGRRTSWPQGWPPKTALQVTEVLDAGRRGYMPGVQPPASPSPWLQALHRLERVHQEEKRVVLEAALADVELEAEREALERYGSHMTDDELLLLSRLVAGHESGLAVLRDTLGNDGVDDASPQSRAEEMVRRLRDVGKEREELIAGLLKSLADEETT